MWQILHGDHRLLLVSNLGPGAWMHFRCIRLGYADGSGTWGYPPTFRHSSASGHWGVHRPDHIKCDRVSLSRLMCITSAVYEGMSDGFIWQLECANGSPIMKLAAYILVIVFRLSSTGLWCFISLARFETRSKSPWAPSTIIVGVFGSLDILVPNTMW